MVSCFKDKHPLVREAQLAWNYLFRPIFGGWL